MKDEPLLPSVVQKIIDHKKRDEEFWSDLELSSQRKVTPSVNTNTRDFAFDQATDKDDFFWSSLMSNT